MSSRSFILPLCVLLAIMAAPPEVEQTLSRLATNPAVRGVLVLARSSGFVIRASGLHFDSDRNAAPAPTANGVIDADSDSASAGANATGGEKARAMAERVHRLVEATSEQVDGLLESKDEARFMRIRLNRYELMITPDERYILVVIHEPPK